MGGGCGGRSRASLIAPGRGADFEPGASPEGVEVHVHAWLDATLREFVSLVQEAHSPARRRNARLDLAVVFPDRSGRRTVRKLAVVHSSRSSGSDARTLKALGIKPGDVMDVALL